MTGQHKDDQRLIHRVEQLTGIADAHAVRRITLSVTSVLLEQLSAYDRARLAHGLPDSLVEPFAEAELPVRAADSLQDFCDRVAAREGIDLGFAREHTLSFCRALAETLDEDERVYLASRLPDELAGLLALPDAERTMPSGMRARARQERRTLSEGRPSSRKPISEAAPERSQQDSVARSDNPHGDTKLSSSAGSTQEREAETLARGPAKR